MNINCILFGHHDWRNDGERNCKCVLCGRTREHKWHAEYHYIYRDDENKCQHCIVCGATREHEWRGCICTRCNWKRDEGHDWSNNCERCAKCGTTREKAHRWHGSECTICSTAIPAHFKHLLDAIRALPIIRSPTIWQRDYNFALNEAISHIEKYYPEFGEKVASFAIGRELIKSSLDGSRWRYHCYAGVNLVFSYGFGYNHIVLTIARHSENDYSIHYDYDNSNDDMLSKSYFL